MNSWEDAPWRGGRAGGYSRRPLEGEPVKGSPSKSVRGPPPLGGLRGDSGTSLRSHIWTCFSTSGVDSPPAGHNTLFPQVAQKV